MMEIQKEKVQQLIGFVDTHLPTNTAGLAQSLHVYDALSTIFDLVNELHMVIQMDPSEARAEGLSPDEVEENIKENDQLLEKNINQVKSFFEGSDVMDIQTLLDECKHAYNMNVTTCREKFCTKPV